MTRSTQIPFLFYFISIFSPSLLISCNPSSGLSPSGGAAGGTAVMGQTPLTRTAWCTADIRENTDRQTRIHFQDNQEFEMSLFELNPNHLRGSEIHRQRGTWAQKDEKTLTISMDGRPAMDMKFELVLRSRDSQEDRLFMGPNPKDNPVFDPCP